MPEYEFKAVDVQGKFVSGVSSAQNRENLSQILQDQGLFLMETTEIGGGHGPSTQTTWLSRLSALMPARKVGLKDVTFCTAQLAIMVRSSLPILESLEILSDQATNPAFRDVLRDVGKKVSQGLPLSGAFALYPKVFDQIYVSLLAAGEAGGDLDVMLDRIASHLDFNLRLNQKIQSALVYPVIVMLTAMAVVGFLVSFVLPTFADIFVQLHIELPWPTRALLYGGRLLREHWHVFMLGGVAAIWGAMRWVKSPRNARTVDGLLLRLPLFGDLTRNIVLTRVLRTLGSLLESGITILHSLELSKAAAGNVIFHDLLEKVARDVKEGKILSASLARGPQIPKVVIGMIATGERTGTLPEVINRVAAFYESETDAS
ncbi:MAG: type II secretion system F family protein, partial [Elusimicrobia bacterium]|nr:type II secretion system F family protein [Elusimicrobiota bacterium]